MTTKLSVAKDSHKGIENVEICYIGRRPFIKNVSHYYMVRPAGSNAKWDTTAFGRKLQRGHLIGNIYPATRSGGIYSTNAADAATGSWPERVNVGEWVRIDENAAKVAAAEKERGSLKTMARKAVTPQLRRAYQRATAAGQVDIIRALVESLEEV